MKITAKILLFVLAAVMLLSSCTQTPPEGPEETSAETPAESSSPAPEESTEPKESIPPESGALGDPVIPDEPKKEKPENPEKTLFDKSKESYNGGNMGCTELAVPAEFNDGVDFDIKSFKDSEKKIYYLFLPCRADLSALTFTATHRDGSVSGPYTADFTDEEVSENEKTIGGINTYSIKVMQSDRPSVMLQIDEQYCTIEEMLGDGSHETHAYGDMVATVTDRLAAQKGWATKYMSLDVEENSHCSMDIRGRGNATWGYPKRPFQFVTENPINLFGMGYAKKYVLLSNYRDATGLRNQLAFEMGDLIGIDYVSDNCQVDLFMNGEYLGMYLLAEKIEAGAGRVEIDHTKDVLYEYDNYAADEPIFGFQTQYSNQKKRGIRIHSPEVESLVNISKARLIKAETALFTGDEEDFQKYFDLDSWARMYLVQMYTMNSDAYYGSFYFYYSSQDRKLHACSPWDFDFSLGVSWGTGSYLDPNRYDLTNREWMKPMMGYRSFLLELLEVYYHKGGKEVIESMPEVIRKLAEENRTSALMNEIGAPTYYYPDDVTNYDEAVDYLLEIAEARVEFMDKLMSDYAAAYRFDKG